MEAKLVRWYLRRGIIPESTNRRFFAVRKLYRSGRIILFSFIPILNIHFRNLHGIFTEFSESKELCIIPQISFN